MNTKIKRMKSLLVKKTQACYRYLKVGTLGLCISLSAGIASAEDIEIFQRDVIDTQLGGGTLNQQVLFVLDTSASMSFGTPIVYEGTFTGTDYVPDTSPVSDLLVHVYTKNLIYTGVTIPQANNVCQTMMTSLTASDSNHFYLDQVVQLTETDDGDDAYWNANLFLFNDDPPFQPNNRLDRTGVIECGNDTGVHGDPLSNADANSLFVRNDTREDDNCGGNCYRSNVNNDFNFRTRAETYVFVHPRLHDYIQNSPDVLTRIGDAAPLNVEAGSSYCSGFVFNNVRSSDAGGNNRISLDETADDFVAPMFLDSEQNSQVSICVSRMGILREVMSSLVETEDISFGIMEFNNGNGGNVLAAIEERDDITALQNTVETIVTRGNTPLAESLHEAYLYLSGGQPDNVDLNTLGDGVVSSGAYDSPLSNQCQSTSVVMLTDGLPNDDNAANAQILALADSEITGDSPPATCGIYNASNGATVENCMPLLAEYMAQTGIDITGTVATDDGGTVSEEQTHFIRTYTVGFRVDGDNLLPDTAAAGTPEGSSLTFDDDDDITTPEVPSIGSFSADNAIQLQAAFETILLNVQDIEDDSFATPSVAASSFNRLEFSDSVYYALFSPRSTPRWNGNVKKYAISPNGEIVDRDGEQVFDTTTSFFAEGTRSFWSVEEDGPNVELGGFASNLTASNTIYADLGNANPTELTLNNFPANVGQIDSLGIPFGENNADSDELDANKERIVRWTLGQDVDGDDPSNPNFYVADAIHSTPTIIAFGTTENVPEEVVFSTSNRGLLHAINAQTGESLWSYIPDEELFTNLGGYYNNLSSSHIYGLDGEMTTRVEFDSDSTASDGIEKAHLFFGQRRGGSNYYAVDVSNGAGLDSGNEVESLWTIEGGLPNTDFVDMGQSWARPISAQINYCTDTDDASCALREVVILSGGYDTQYDNIELGETTTVASLAGNVKGNALYIVAGEDFDGTNIDGGDLLWMASDEIPVGVDGLVLNDMDHSFPSAPTAVDITGDGAIDLIFTVDIAGRVWRFDLAARSDDLNDVRDGANDEIAGGIIADLSEPGLNRLFYNGVETTLVEDTSTGGNLKYTLLTGSGHTAHPLDEGTVEDRMYVLFDRNIIDPLFDVNGDAVYTYVSSGGSDRNIEASDLAAITSTITETNGVIEGTSDLDVEIGGVHEFGYFIALGGDHEKSLDAPLLVDSLAIFTTYLPTTGLDPCSTNIGSSMEYSLDLATGVFVAEEGQAGRSPSPVLIFFEQDGENIAQILIGTSPPKDPPEPLAKLTNVAAPRAIKTIWWEEDREN